jgi:hypothetical protein
LRDALAATALNDEPAAAHSDASVFKYLTLLCRDGRDDDDDDDDDEANWYRGNHRNSI